MLKRIFIPAMLCVVLLGGYGCMNILPKSDESIRDEILEQLSKKYDKKFIAISLDRGHTSILLCHAEGEDPEENLVHAQQITRDNDVEYKDTYFGIMIRDEIETEIMSMYSNSDLPIRVYYPSNEFYYDNIFDGTKTYADFRHWIINGNPWRFDITIVSSLDDITESEEYANQVFEKLAKSDSRLFVYLCVLPNEGFTNVTRTTLNDVISQYDGRTAVYTKSIN